MIKTASLTLACVTMLAVTAQQAQAAPISPEFDSFGSFSPAIDPLVTFGGTGIPKDAVAITTIETFGNTITLGLTATGRFIPSAVTGNDGAGTFSALAGGFPGGPGGVPAPDPTLARWNVGYFIYIDGTATLDDFAVSLLYDFDPAVATDDAVHGAWDLSATFPGSTLAQDSQNLGFGFLASVIPGFIVPPAFGAFDPNAEGEYSFALRISDVTGFLGESAILVNATNAVPEPISASLFGIGALGLAIGGVRRRRRKQTA